MSSFWLFFLSGERDINKGGRWSRKLGEYPAGDPELHHVVGSLFAEEHDTEDAERHLILGTKESPEDFSDEFECFKPAAWLMLEQSREIKRLREEIARLRESGEYLEACDGSMD